MRLPPPSQGGYRPNREATSGAVVPGRPKYLLLFIIPACLEAEPTTERYKIYLTFAFCALVSLIMWNEKLW
jgi:hypothetical protein